VQVQQEQADVAYQILARSPAAQTAQDAAIVHDYFNVGTRLQPLAASWAKQDERFGKLWNSIQGRISAINSVLKSDITMLRLHVLCTFAEFCVVT
jgi:hypothetical protein